MYHGLEWTRLTDPFEVVTSKENHRHIEIKRNNVTTTDTINFLFFADKTVLIPTVIVIGLCILVGGIIIASVYKIRKRRGQMTVGELNNHVIF